MRLFVTSLLFAVSVACASPALATVMTHPARVFAPASRAAMSTSWKRVKPAIKSKFAVAIAPTPPPAGAALFSDTFEQDSAGLAASGWSASTGSWAVCAPGGATNQYCQTSYNSGVAMQLTPWGDYQVDAIAYDRDFSTGGLALLGRMQNESQFYQLQIKKDSTSGVLSWFIAKTDGAVWTKLASGPLTQSATNSYRLRLAFFGSQISAWLAPDGGTAYQYLGSVFDTQFPTGTVGFRTFSLTSGRFDDINVTNGSSFIAPNAATETPLRADLLADSVGVNVDVPNMALAAVPVEASATLALGVRHVRVGLLKNYPAYDNKLNQFLTTSGTLALGSTDCPSPLGYYATAGIVAADVAAFETAIGGRLEAYEALNEPDARGYFDSHWAADTVPCMQTQTNAVAGIPYLAPALVNSPANAAALGNLSSLADLGNLHRYFSGNNPGTPGWGGRTTCGVYGALNWALCEAAINSGAKPVVITETGYNSQTEVDEPTQAKYLSRAIFVNSQAGVPRSYIYCLQSYTGGDGFGGTGLLRADRSPKPAFTAIQSEIAAFSDGGTDAIPRAPLSYSIGSAPVTMQHELFQKRDGTYLLAVWNEAVSWKTNGGPAIVVPSAPVTVTLPFVPRIASAQALNDLGVFKASVLTKAANSLTFAVDDHMTVFAFKQ